MRKWIVILLVLLTGVCFAQEVPSQSSPLTLSQMKLEELIQKKAEYHRLTSGVKDGYRIKIHFGVDRDAAEAVRLKFLTKFPDYSTYKEYQQPNFVVLVGDYPTKLEAFESLKQIQAEFANAFIVKGKIRVK